MSQELINEFLRLEQARESLEGFRKYMSVTGHPDFQFPHEPHHAVMAEALERIASGDLKRLIMQLPPGSAKSTITSIQFSLWYWCLFPNHHILRCSATQSLAEKFARRVRSAAQTKEYARISGSSIDPQHQSVTSFANTLGGTQTAAGVGTSIIGLRSNLSILDDPVASFEQITSDTQRKAMVEWYRAEYRSRLVPTGAEVIVTTRWDAKDIVGEILGSEEADTWEVIRIPMVCDSDADPIGRKIGDRLWTEWFTEQMVVEAMREPLRWAGMYQQVPLASEGDWMNADDTPIVDQIPEDLGVYGALDIAMTEGAGDFSVCMVAGMSKDGTLYLLDMWRDRVTPDNIIEALIKLNHIHDMREILIDDDAGAKVFRNLAHKILRQRHEPLPLHPMPTRGQNKEARAMAFRGLAKMGGVKMLRGPWNGEVLRETTTFPFGHNDDIIDTLSLLGRRAAAMGGKTPPKEEGDMSIESTFVEHDGVVTTRATFDQLWSDNKKNSRSKIIRI